jgi:hypothetical protein
MKVADFKEFANKAELGEFTGEVAGFGANKI